VTEIAEGAKTVPDSKPAYRTKLIEVALPLEAINIASAREKSIRHGHPSTLHLWWARRPLAACRAVLFSQLVDDPSAWPELFPTEEAQEAERQRLFRIIEALVQWESSTNETILHMARREIARSLARGAGIPEPETPEEVGTVLREHAPPVLDPFCGGGSIPLEAQRLGLEAHGSDLNPVAVLITKALIEIPPRFAGMPPVNPRDRERAAGFAWKGAAGLAADVRYYGEWMREEAFKRIGHLYPKARLPDGGEATVIAWLWARTVICPNPACGARMPLVRSFVLAQKPGKEAWVLPIADEEKRSVRFEVRDGTGIVDHGTMTSSGARCLVCGTAVPFRYVRTEGEAGRMSQQLMAMVTVRNGRRVYLAPSPEQADAALQAVPNWEPEDPLPEEALGFRVQGYGITEYRQLFTRRQSVALSTFTELAWAAQQLPLKDAAHRGPDDDGRALREGGKGARAYGEAVAVYLALGIGRSADFWSTLSTWSSSPKNELVMHAFTRAAMGMTWDYAEANPFSDSGGNFLGNIDFVAKALGGVPSFGFGGAVQADAASRSTYWPGITVATDPPYYDNIGYADLSDFFYIWLRRVVRTVYPELFSTVLVPKSDELIAAAHRFGGDPRRAKKFFESGLGRAFACMAANQDPHSPLTVYYAFKQVESQHDVQRPGTAASTGWESMLEGLVGAGLSVAGTWPMRTEGAGRLRARGSNALASSIVLVCRHRSQSAPLATHREFVAALRRELPQALTNLQHGNIAPVDLAQASIGPGMAIFSRYSKVLEADGSAMSVRTALQLINQELDAYLTALEGELDPDTRFCVAWFEQYGMKTAKFGEADVLARAKNTSPDGLERAGVIQKQGGNVRLLTRSELDPQWDPLTDRRITDWECCQHLILALDGGEDEAARLAQRMGSDKAQTARDLAYRLYAICERKGWAEEALAYNGLAVSWPAIQEKMAAAGAEQASFEL
jgi:putative DNA methylase